MCQTNGRKSKHKAAAPYDADAGHCICNDHDRSISGVVTGKFIAKQSGCLGQKQADWERKVFMRYFMDFWNEEDGIGIIEIILILVILVAIVVIFREQISSIVSNAFKQINGGADTINEEISID